jgi:hypothetical protein
MESDYGGVCIRQGAVVLCLSLMLLCNEIGRGVDGA